MSLEAILNRRSRQTIHLAWINQFKSILSGDWFPRGSDANVISNAATLGSETYQFKREFIHVGTYGPGDLQFLYDYNGKVDASQLQGWMFCDGRVINQTNYDAEHGAGSWASYVGTSVLNGLYLPNMDTKFLSSSANPTQSGAAPLTFTGSNTVNIQHNHGTAITTQSNNNSNHTGTLNNHPFQPVHTHQIATTNDLSTAEESRPESIPCRVYMRII